MSRYLTPAGVVEARPVVQKSTGQQFIRDPKGHLWRLDDCQPIPERDPAPPIGVVDASYFELGLIDRDPDPPPPDPLARTITADEWGSLKAAAADLSLTGADLIGIVQDVTGQTRGSLITLRQMEVIFERMEQLYLGRQP